MNTDQVKGALKEAAGKVQQKAGELIDSPDNRPRDWPSRWKAPPRRKWAM
jgi:hypothetical protein